MDIENYKIIAAIFGVIGSVILAYRNKKIQSAQTLVASAQDHNTRQMMRNSGDIVIFGELEKYLKKSQEKGLLYTGYLFFILAILFYLYALFITN